MRRLLAPLVAFSGLLACASSATPTEDPIDWSAGTSDASASNPSALTLDATPTVVTGDSAAPGDDASATAALGEAGSTPNDLDDAGDAGAPGSVAPRPVQGEILVTEVMFDPSGAEPDNEWFEVTNAASSARDLGGLTMTDGATTPHSETIAGSVVVQPGAYVVFASAKIGGSVSAAAIAYEYSTLTLVNGTTGTIVLSDGATTLAQAPYGAWGDAVNGASVQLSALTYADESIQASWCVSASPWSGATDDGTPGAPSDCP